MPKRSSPLHTDRPLAGADIDGGVTMLPREPYRAIVDAAVGTVGDAGFETPSWSDPTDGNHWRFETKGGGQALFDAEPVSRRRDAIGRAR